MLKGRAGYSIQTKFAKPLYDTYQRLEEPRREELSPQKTDTVVEQRNAFAQ